MIRFFKNIKKLNLTDALLLLVASWVMALWICACMSKNYLITVSYASSESIVLLLLLTAAVFAVGLVASCWKKNIVIFGTLNASVWLYGAYASYIASNAYVAIAFSLVALAVLIYSAKYFDIWNCGVRIGKRTAISLAVAAAVLSFAYVSILTVFRYLSYTSPCFDFGIFTQMFDNMRQGLGALTTCERGEPLSHFAVHFSPIYYLILPFYYIFPSPVTVAVAQGAILASGVIPLALIGKKIGLSHTKNAAICVLYSVFPALIGGCFYDIHENVFLAPLILWVMYFIEKEQYVGVFVFSLLTLGVKEDAAIYVVSIALFVFFGRKKRVRGAALLLLAVAYFFTVTHFMMKNGDGIMLGGRYYNIIGYQGSFTDLVRTAVVNPAIYVIESFTPEKLLFVLLMILPLGLLPFIKTKVSEFLLFIPLLVMNLISDYPYQHDIGFQYVFGSSVLLFYVAAKNLERMRSESDLAKILALYAMSASLFIGSARYTGQAYGLNRYEKEKEIIAVMDQTLSEVDRTRDISASTMIVAHLYDVDELYSLEYYTKETECVILDLRPYASSPDGCEEYVETFVSRGYEVEVYHEGIIAVLGRAEN